MRMCAALGCSGDLALRVACRRHLSRKCCPDRSAAAGYRGATSRSWSLVPSGPGRKEVAGLLAVGDAKGGHEVERLVGLVVEMNHPVLLGERDEDPLDDVGMGAGGLPERA